HRRHEEFLFRRRGCGWSVGYPVLQSWTWIPRYARNDRETGAASQLRVCLGYLSESMTGERHG
ncbi:MAG: hypothetical protein OXI33_12440, partial [Chloroflexota bacterium]|nr:hypothetical protein [Chloroflexota bacterium]